MAVAAGCYSEAVSGRAGLGPRLAVAGSLVLRRMDRRGHKRGLVRARKHGTKRGSGAHSMVSGKGTRHTHPGVLVREYNFPYECRISAGFGAQFA